MENTKTGNVETDIVVLKKAEYVGKTAIFDKEYTELNKKIGAAQNKIAWHEKRIERLQRKRAALKYPSWTEELLRPILEELVRLTPEIAWRIDSLSTFGLRCDCPVFGKTKEQTTVGITFTQHDGQLYYDTGETKGNFQSGSIGAMNGFNHVTEPVESIDTLLNHVKKGIEREIQELNNPADKEKKGLYI